MSLRDIGRVDESHVVLKEIFSQRPASEKIGDLKKMATRTWSSMSEEDRKPYKDQYSQIIFVTTQSDLEKESFDEDEEVSRYRRLLQQDA
eukprot:11867793-Karenia_brevis.AAC.1